MLTYQQKLERRIANLEEQVLALSYFMEYDVSIEEKHKLAVEFREKTDSLGGFNHPNHELKGVDDK